MEQRTYYVWRNALFPQVITMGDVIDSTHMHINDLLRPNSTPKRSKMLKHGYWETSLTRINGRVIYYNRDVK